MDFSSIGSILFSGSSGGAQGAVDLIMLKKSQGLAKSMAEQLLNTLPPVKPAHSANPPGVGGKLDLVA